MYKADWNIVRKLREYDPHLSIKWNTRKEYFEVWRDMGWGKGHKLITPITRSIYKEGAPQEYVEPDERLITWLFGADSWAHGGSRELANKQEEYWREGIKKRDKQLKGYIRDAAKDSYGPVNYHFVTKHKSKNGPPRFNNAKKNTWVRPDQGALSSSRLMSRSKKNALKYNWKPK